MSRDHKEEYPEDLRQLRNIALEIIRLHPNPNRFPLWSYLTAMTHMIQINHLCGMEYGEMVVAHVLDKLATWHGEDAKRLKDELHDHLDWYNKCGRFV